MLAPDNATFHTGLGAARAAQGMLDGALESYGKAVELEASDEVAWCELGNLLLHKGEPKKASESFDAALGIDVDFAAAWVGKARAVMALKGPKAARKYVDEALAISPDLPEARSLRKELLERSKG